MVYASDLKPIEAPSFRIRGEITLSELKQRLQDYNDQNYGLPVRIDFDQIKSGGLFNSSLEDCLTITNLNHAYDYFKYCITVRRQGMMSIVTMTYYGQSTLTGQKNKQQEREESGSLGGMLLNIFKSVDNSQYQAEYEYYDMLEAMYTEFFE